MEQNGFLGMDVDGAQTGSRDLGSHSTDLRSISGNIGRLLEGLGWEGEDARKFMAEWQSFSPAMVTQADSAHGRSKELLKRAQMQIEASSQ